MRAFRARSRHAMLALRIGETAFSSLPTLLASHPESLRDRRGLKVLPTLSASFESGNRGGANPDGPFRPSLHEMARRGTLPTLTSRDEKGPGPAHTKGGSDLSGTMGGHLNPAWCLWFMGFPADWLDVDDAHVFARSGTRSSRSARKSPDG